MMLEDYSVSTAQARPNSSMTSSLVSIVIPVYNTGPYLEKCLESVLRQTHRNIEVIIINDGSTDNSSIVVEVYRRRDGRVIVITQENQGLSESRNNGIAISSGKYVCFVDSDDWISDSYIERLLSCVDSADLVAASYNRVYASRYHPRILGWAGLFPAGRFKRKLLGPYKEDLSDPSQLDSMATACCKMYRLDVIKANGLEFASTKLIGTEDLLFNLQYVELIDRVMVVDEPIYFYRRNNSGSLTTIYKPDLFDKWAVRHDMIAEKVGFSTAEERAAFKNRVALSIVGLCLNEIANPEGWRQVHLNVKRFLSDGAYKEAISQLDMSYFPVHWKIYFVSARRGYSGVLVILSKAISWILSAKNK